MAADDNVGTFQRADLHYHHAVKSRQLDVLGTKMSGFKLWDFELSYFLMHTNLVRSWLKS
jgi:hypothetical protein